MEAMKSQFTKNYPGEILDAHSTPSIRLWSLIHQQKVNEHIKHVLIQLRLSEHQYCAMIETRSSKPLRSEMALLSPLCWDDTPEMDINSVRFSDLYSSLQCLRTLQHVPSPSTQNSRLQDCRAHFYPFLRLRHVIG